MTTERLRIMAENEKIITSERKRVIVAFGDITGFSQWIKRAGTSIEKHFELTEHIYHKAMNLAFSSAYHIKLLGDGFVMVKEIDFGNGRDIALKYVKDIHDMAIDIQSTIKSLPFPRPDGFRVRIVSGFVTKIKMNFCDIDKPCEMRSDYVGYIMNLANRLLFFMEENPFICHESVKELIGDPAKEDSYIVDMYKLGESKVSLSGVDDEDLKATYSFTVRPNDKH